MASSHDQLVDDLADVVAQTFTDTGEWNIWTIARAVAAEVEAVAAQRAAEELAKAGRFGYFTRTGQAWAAGRAAALAQPE